MRKCGDSGFRGKCSHTSRGLGERCIRRESPECPSRVVISLREEVRCPRTTANHPRNVRASKETANPSERSRYALENHGYPPTKRPSAQEKGLSVQAKQVCARDPRLSAHETPERPRERLIRPSEVGMRPRTTTIHLRKKSSE